MLVHVGVLIMTMEVTDEYYYMMIFQSTRSKMANK